MTTAQGTRGRFIAWGLIVLAFAYVVLSGGAWQGQFRPELRIPTLIITTLLLAGWAVAARRDPIWRLGSQLTPAIAAGLAALTLSTVFSRDVRVSVEYLAYEIGRAHV